jgi:hypothetical protein
MQPTKPRNPLCTRAQHEVVGITQDDIGADLSHSLRLHRLYRCSSANGHESGRPNIASVHFDAASTCPAVRGIDAEFKPLGHGGIR